MELLPSHQFIEQLFGPGGVQQLLQRLRVGEQTVDLSGLVLVDAFQGLVKGALLQLCLLYTSFERRRTFCQPCFSQGAAVADGLCQAIPLVDQFEGEKGLLPGQVV